MEQEKRDNLIQPEVELADPERTKSRLGAYEKAFKMIQESKDAGTTEGGDR